APAVAVTGQVDGEDVVLRQQERGDEAPPVGVGGTTVDEDQPGPGAVAPPEVVDVAGLDAHRALLGPRGQGFREPRRRARPLHGGRMVPPGSRAVRPTSRPPRT